MKSPENPESDVSSECSESESAESTERSVHPESTAPAESTVRSVHPESTERSVHPESTAPAEITVRSVHPESTELSVHPESTAPAEHPIVALATPFGVSALSVIRVSGHNSIAMLSQLCVEGDKLNKVAANSTHPYQLVDSHTNDPLERAMISIYRAPRSFTGEDSADITIHGSTAGIDRMIESLNRVGFSNAEPGEFSKRAFLNGKLNLTEAEAMHELIQAQNENNHIEALQKMGGSVLNFVDKIKEDLLGLVAACHVSLDYPEDEIQESVEIRQEDLRRAINRIDQLLVGYKFSQLRKNTAKVMLVGRANAGKSSIYNALLKTDRAIVSDKPGTTRDFLESGLMLYDIPITLYDGAGFRSKQEEKRSGEVEQEGIARSRYIAAHVSILLYVVDLIEGWTDADTKLVKELAALHKDDETLHKASIKEKGAKTAKTNPTDEIRFPFRILLLWNKVDAKSDNHIAMNLPSEIQKLHAVLDKGLCISAKKYSGLDELQKSLYQSLVSDMQLPDPNMPLLSSLHQKQCLEQCKEALIHVQEALAVKVPLDMISLDLDQALSSLANLTGASYTEDLLERIFSDFCVGK